MKKTSIGTLLVFLLIFSGCSNTNPEITEAEAIELVQQSHEETFGTVDILSVSYENGRYIIEWKNKENCEKGIDFIDGESGEINIDEAPIC
ncbi:hypothetical protein [Planococcus soli]|uniref:hypothetical protein n=1 Tax=Planococcus soli TaxID=2666072 RepID=UPI00115F5842|nr:hypothetical protein [Planococcus soli]